MADSRDFRLGSIWLVSFDPSCGKEIQKTRPALVVSGTEFNQQRSKITVLPFTSLQPSDRRVSPVTVLVSPTSQNKLDRESLLICVDIITFDKGRCIRYLGQLENEILEQVKNIIRRYLNLN